MGRSHQNRF